MCELLKKDVKFEFNDICKKAFDSLKMHLTSSPIIQSPDWTRPFEIMCDASNYAVGAVLGQKEARASHVIHYASMTLNEAQRNYSTMEEMLAVVFALEKFRQYLLGIKVIVYTDHAALRYLLMKKSNKSGASSREGTKKFSLSTSRELLHARNKISASSSVVWQRSGSSGGNYRKNENTDSSDEEYFEEEEETITHQQNRTNQLSPASSSPSSNRRGLRTLRSSPVLRAGVDKVLGVPIPRRAPSASAKKFHEYRNSASGEFSEDLSHRKFSPSPEMWSPIGFDGMSPSSVGVSMKKKMKYVDRRTRGLSSVSNLKPFSVIQDDIEIEVAKALFDLMKQSYSQSQSSEREEKVNIDGTNNDDIDDECLPFVNTVPE